jgi:hypothetical protein
MYRLLLLAAVSCSSAGQSPLSGLRTPRAEEVTRVGRVAELVQAGSYTYLRLEQNADWFVSTRDVHLHQAVALRIFGVADSFASARLNRTFSPLSFAIVTTQEKNP